MKVLRVLKSLQLRHVVPFSFLLAAAFTFGCGGGDAAGNGGNGHGPGASGEKPEDPAIAVKVGDVVLEPISSLYSTSATLRADRRPRSSPAPAASSKDSRWKRAIGSRGQPLAYLEDDEQKIAAARARATGETAQREHERWPVSTIRA